MFLVSCLTSLGTGPFIREKRGCGNRYPRLLSIGNPIKPHEWEGFEHGREVAILQTSITGHRTEETAMALGLRDPLGPENFLARRVVKCWEWRRQQSLWKMPSGLYKEKRNLIVAWLKLGKWTGKHLWCFCPIDHWQPMTCWRFQFWHPLHTLILVVCIGVCPWVGVAFWGLPLLFWSLNFHTSSLSTFSSQRAPFSPNWSWCQQLRWVIKAQHV